MICYSFCEQHKVLKCECRKYGAITDMTHLQYAWNRFARVDEITEPTTAQCLVWGEREWDRRDTLRSLTTVTFGWNTFGTFVTHFIFSTFCLSASQYDQERKEGRNEGWTKKKFERHVVMDSRDFNNPHHLNLLFALKRRKMPLTRSAYAKVLNSLNLHVWLPLYWARKSSAEYLQICRFSLEKIRFFVEKLGFHWASISTDDEFSQSELQISTHRPTSDHMRASRKDSKRMHFLEVFKLSAPFEIFGSCSCDSIWLCQRKSVVAVKLVSRVLYRY